MWTTVVSRSIREWWLSCGPYVVTVSLIQCIFVFSCWFFFRPEEILRAVLVCRQRMWEVLAVVMKLSDDVEELGDLVSRVLPTTPPIEDVVIVEDSMPP